MSKIFLFILFFVSVQSAVDLRCTDDFCLDYRTKFKCKQLDPVCNNSTLSLKVPAPTTCNCCEHCFIFLEEGESCTVGNGLNPLPDKICGPGLKCVNFRCEKGEVAPPEYTCQDDQCYCSSPDGKTIFGHFDPDDSIQDEKQCGCSINSFYASKMKLQQFKSSQGSRNPNVARCLLNGQYNPIQCSDDFCFCVDKETGQVDDTVGPVHVKAIRKGYPRCFNETYGHTNGGYYTECEQKRIELVEDLGVALVEGVIVIVSDIPNCSEDGTYK